MIELVKFEAAHLAAIEVQGVQQFVAANVSETQGDMLEKGISYTAMCDGEPIAAAGLVDVWEGRGVVWACLSEVGPKAFLMIHRAVTKVLDASPLKRIEMLVDCTHDEGHRWAMMLGFQMEAVRMRNYSPDGRDFSLYARVQ